MRAAVAEQDAWLGATSVHSADPRVPALLDTLRELCDANPALHLVINHFDTDHSAATPVGNIPSTPRLQVSWVPGMKGIFWKTILTPRRTRAYRVIWLFDADLALHPSVLPLATIVNTLLATNASLLQPAIRAAGGETQHTWLRARATHISCMVTTARFVELQTPFFVGDAWADFHTRVLSHVSDGALARSSFGLDVTWCGALAHAFPERPACLVVHHANAVHLNAQTVEKFSTTQVRSFDRQCSETCQELRRRFPSYYANESHHSRHCWRVNVTNGRIAKDESDARLVVDVKGRVRASVRVLHEQADLESGVPHHAAAQWLGVTSLRSTERTRTEALTAAVRALCDRHPALRVVINHNDAGTPADLRRPAKGSETDERIQTTYMPTTLLLWRRVLSPRNLATRNVKVLWFFSKDAVVHPSVFPLAQLVDMLFATGASLIQPRSRGKRHEHSCMAAHTRIASVHSPILRVEAWTLFYQRVLSAARSRSPPVDGLNLLWCPLLELVHPRRAGCVEAASIGARQLRDGESDPSAECNADPRPCWEKVRDWMDRSRFARVRPALALQLIGIANQSLGQRANASCWGVNRQGGLSWKRGWR